MGKKPGQGGDADFEKMFGKDIDEFLEDSDWDIESFDQMSQFSKGTSRSVLQDGRLRGLESIYLQRLETAMKKGGKGATSKNNKQAKKPKFRVMQDRFVDDPTIMPDVVEHATSDMTRNRRPGFPESANTTTMNREKSDRTIFQNMKR